MVEKKKKLAKKAMTMDNYFLKYYYDQLGWKFGP